MVDAVARIECRARSAGFDQSSSLAVGSLLSVLAAAKPAGRILELGTGAGLGAIHLLQGMSSAAHLITVEMDGGLSLLAQEEIADPRVGFVVADGGDWLESQVSAHGTYDLVFADTWPGKFDHLDEALALLAPGGVYLVDDLMTQDTWPAGHQARVDALTARLSELSGWTCVKVDALTGVMICARLES